MKMPALKHASSSPQPCKICGQAAPLYGVVDFNKSCEEHRGLRLPLAGIPIYYRRCTACGFLFTDAFDDWSVDEFRAHIYNDGYATVDPDYQTARPNANAETVLKYWGEIRTQIRVLDFGGGSDTLCANLRAAGFTTAVSYDPIVPELAQRPEGKFDLVTCIETMEHMPDPLAGIASIVDCAADPGLVFYSTMLVPQDIDARGLSWWYVGPRNGHVSLFTQQALAIAWSRHGYKTVSLNDGVHFAFRTLPAYLKLQGDAAAAAAA
jgi:2-polyprenyl-6-hydroxyphenyl methylase/3-demethylubiquinone-9 3-methyltransferase